MTNTFLEPITTLLGGPEMYINKGSTMNLTCVVKHSPEPPPSIYWTHNSQFYSLNVSDLAFTYGYRRKMIVPHLLKLYEQRVNFKFLVKLGKHFTEAYAMLKEIYGKEYLTVYKFLNSLNSLKRGVNRPKTIRAPDGPQRQKRTKTLVNQSAKIVV
ncbi:hypothetical protein NQ318_005466 [Aromia moschata]|uniref:Ig-like domain-containing protein n=1 Tax=Aromia moschata TaxID=1265417 RepID=A0AAV8YX20_9CUCU|nr:hypothetical protein NQ318_005466 [Aromia moschata]